jgi:hypothetical protein
MKHHRRSPMPTTPAPPRQYTPMRPSERAHLDKGEPAPVAPMVHAREHFATAKAEIREALAEVDPEMRELTRSNAYWSLRLAMRWRSIATRG